MDPIVLHAWLQSCRMMRSDVPGDAYAVVRLRIQSGAGPMVKPTELELLMALDAARQIMERGERPMRITIEAVDE